MNREPVGRSEMSRDPSSLSGLLAGFAAGTLDSGEHLAVAVHASGCSTCRRLCVRSKVSADRRWESSNPPL